MSKEVQPKSSINRDIFYELDDKGTVLHAEFINNRNFEDRSLDAVIGQNLFEKILQYRNADDLKLNYLSFVSGGLTTKNLVFNAELFEKKIPLNIIFVRVWQNAQIRHKTLYLIYIKSNF